MSTTNIGASVLSGSQSTSGGLGTGIDIATMVSASMAPQLAELAVMQGQQTQITNQQTALNTFNNDLQTLDNAVFALTDPLGQISSVTATSSAPSVVTASATAGTAAATHTVTVTNLATTASSYSDPVKTSSTTIANGTLSIQVGTNTAVPITIDSTNNTLDGLASTINNTANIGVTASVINDANGARLAIVSNTSGLAGNLTITPSSGGLGFYVGATGANAKLTVDNIPVESTSNTVSSAIAGVTLNLTAATGAPVTITTGPDTTQQASVVNSFVSAYNTVIGDLNKQFAIDPTTGQPGALASDSTLALTQNQLLSAVAFASSGNGTVNSLASLGVTLNNDGTLTVDSGKLATALQSNSAGALSFFDSLTNSQSFGSNLKTVLDNLSDQLTGSVASDINGLTQSQASITKQISDFQIQLNTTSQQLTAQFVQVNATLEQLPILLDQLNQQLTSLG